ncbi:four-carbon acid sugar kinase family protein [Achromobacter deleyi]|uniref:four-carbon acid sugar kinase family protein n=1 Tax=Achromobacter deleyi TaxID=1353891 RepID=UPI001491FA6D|nr:four-carbon acid sugar kinase family protein [Achromobacter deleyi]QVQ27632.1 four-carbon acid sugar kinase family protein [Achromobacter deleyi]UIP23229.1 four-carbon acid sugar kinase family protein [Achromobacter deleyi]
MTDSQRSASAPQVCWYGDDFTGATDTLAEVARAGLRGLLFLGVPTPEQLRRAGPLDAIGIAGAARGMAPAEMATELRAVGRFMAGTGARVLHYKCCSTFDSAPHVGSIGAAIRELRRHMPNPMVPIVGGQPSIGRYCSFAQLFARAGSAPEIHRIDRHPVMSAHPVTPMHEADLRLHLQAQGLSGIRSVPHTTYPPLRRAADAPALENWIEQIIDTTGGPVLLDLVDDEQLAVIGRLIWRAASRAPLLAVGPSSVQQALARAMPAAREGVAQAPPLVPAAGAVLVVAGSLSPVTARQIAACQRYARQPLQVERLLADPDYAARQAQQAAATLAQGHNVLAHTDKPAGAVSAQDTAATARATGKLVADIVRNSALAGSRLSRIGIAGGDTSSQATLALGLWGLAFRCVLAPGVTVSVTRSDDPLTDGIELMLKGGQMGGDLLFDELAAGKA